MMEPYFHFIMNINYIFSTNFSYITILKIIIILFLLFLNILLLLYTEISDSHKIKQSGLFGRPTNLLANTSTFFVSSAGLYASYITIKDHLIKKKNIDDLTKENTELDRQYNIAKEEIKHLKEENAETKKTFLNVVDLAQQNNQRQLTYVKQKSKIETELAELKKAKESSTVLSEIKKYEEEIQLKNSLKDSLSKEQEKEILDNHKKWESLIGKGNNDGSNFLGLDYNFNDFLENFSLIEKISLCFLLLNQIILSSLISIIFLIYGDFLIKKYQLETRYPKLAKLIQYRRKFTKYYMYLNISLIIGAFLVENIFLISVLLLKFT